MKIRDAGLLLTLEDAPRKWTVKHYVVKGRADGALMFLLIPKRGRNAYMGTTGDGRKFIEEARATANDGLIINGGFLGPVDEFLAECERALANPSLAADSFESSPAEIAEFMESLPAEGHA